MLDASVVPDLAASSLVAVADHDDGPENAAPARGQRVAVINRAYGAGSGMLARLVRLVLGGVLLVILVGILLALLRANPGNGVVSQVHGWGRWLVGPFGGMFSLHRARVALAVNWGIAAVAYLLAGALISSLIGRSGNRHAFASRSIPKQEAA